MINNILLPILPSRLQNYFRNGLIQFYRFIALILCPLIIIYIFDNGCHQNWKLLWPYCVEGNNEYLQSECYKLDSLHTLYNSFVNHNKRCYKENKKLRQTLNQTNNTINSLTQRLQQLENKFDNEVKMEKNRFRVKK